MTTELETVNVRLDRILERLDEMLALLRQAVERPREPTILERQLGQLGSPFRW